MEITTFDDLESTQGGESKKPFFAMNHDNESDLLTWLKDELYSIKQDSVTRLEKVKNNYLRYKGIQYQNQVYQPRDTFETRRKYQPRIVIPLIRDAVDEMTARLLEFKPSVVVMPVHDEAQDKSDATVAKKFLKHVEHAQKLDEKFHKLVKNSKIAGESYLWLRWNPDIGEPVKEVAMLREVGEFEKMTMLFEGDLEVKNLTPHWVYYERASTWDDVNYAFVLEYDYTEAVKSDYPEAASKIGSEAQERIFNFESMQEQSMAGKTLKVHFYHKRTKYMPEGYECCFTQNAILKKGPLSYKHGKLPLIRLIDGQNEEELHGESFIESVRGIASQVNNMMNIAVKHINLASFAKWFVEAGSIDEQQLSNDVSIVRLKTGAQKPILAQANPVSEQVIKLIDSFKQLFYDMAKSNSVIRGEPPAGVTAFVALQYTSESENRRMNTSIVQIHQAIRETYDMSLSVCGQFYKKGSHRTMLILGKDNRWDAQGYDPETLSKDYSIIIQNTSALPDSKALRTQYIVDMQKAYPGMIPQEQAVEMLGFGQSEKFNSIASAAAAAAEAENEIMLDGGEMIEPAEHEDHLVHWKIHTMAIQSLGFKTKTPVEIQERMKNHILATEFLMSKQATKSPAYAQVVGQIPNWPMYYELGPIVQLPSAQDVGPGTHGAVPEQSMNPENMAKAQAMKAQEMSMAANTATPIG